VLAAGRSRGLERFEASRGVGREGGIEGGIDGGTGRECPGRGDEGRAGTWGSSRSAERDPAEDLDRGLRDDGEEEEQPAEQRQGHGADDEIAHEHGVLGIVVIGVGGHASTVLRATPRSEEHTSELQSRENLVCRLLLDKKKCKGYGAR